MNSILTIITIIYILYYYRAPYSVLLKFYLYKMGIYFRETYVYAYGFIRVFFANFVSDFVFDEKEQNIRNSERATWGARGRIHRFTHHTSNKLQGHSRFYSNYEHNKQEAVSSADDKIRLLGFTTYLPQMR